VAAASLRSRPRRRSLLDCRLPLIFLAGSGLYSRGAIERLGQEPKGTTCPGIDGLIKEAYGLAGEVEDKIVLDAAIISSAQAIEHYEISRYDLLVGWAQQLGHQDVGELLQANLNEEKDALRKLSTLDQAAALRGRGYIERQTR
jgi:hypothetical protein